MDAVGKAVLKDAAALKEIGRAIIGSQGYRLPEESLLAGLTEAVHLWETGGAKFLEQEGPGGADVPEDSVEYFAAASIKKSFSNDKKILKGFGELGVHAGLHRLPSHLRLRAACHVVETYDNDNDKKEAWRQDGARFFKENRQPRRLRKPPKTPAGAPPKSPSRPANDAGSKPATPQAPKVAGMEA